MVVASDLLRDSRSSQLSQLSVGYVPKQRTKRALASFPPSLRCFIRARDGEILPTPGSFVWIGGDEAVCSDDELFFMAPFSFTGGSKKKDGCTKPTLKNGKIKPRSNGRVVKYSCNRDYILVGESTSTCLQGEWTSETPVCVGMYCSSSPSTRLVFLLLLLSSTLACHFFSPDVARPWSP